MHKAPVGLARIENGFDRIVSSYTRHNTLTRLDQPCTCVFLLPDYATEWLQPIHLLGLIAVTKYMDTTTNLVKNREYKEQIRISLTEPKPLDLDSLSSGMPALASLRKDKPTPVTEGP